MNKQPKTIKQLRRRLATEYTDVFPFGKYKDQLAADVVKHDPNYVVWWNDAIERCPLDPKVVSEGRRTYRFLPRSGHWRGSVGHWDHWGDDGVEWGDLEELGYFDTLEGIAGDPWGNGD